MTKRKVQQGVAYASVVAILSGLTATFFYKNGRATTFPDKGSLASASTRVAPFKSSNPPVSASLASTWSKVDVKRAMTETLRTTFNGLYLQRDFYNKEMAYEQAFDKLAATPEMLELAAEVVGNPERFNSILGEDLPVARTYAVKLLTARGASRPGLLNNVMNSIIQTLESGGEVVPGQAFDLDLIVKSVLKDAVQDASEWTPQAAQLVARRLVGTSKKLSSDSGEAIALAFFARARMALPEERSWEIARAVAAELS